MKAIFKKGRKGKVGRGKPKGKPPMALRRKISLDWGISSIEGMERTAKNEADGDCSLRIGDHWLCVTYDPTSRAFTYQWGKTFVDRDSAVKVHKVHRMFK